MPDNVCYHWLSHKDEDKVLTIVNQCYRFYNKLFLL